MSLLQQPEPALLLRIEDRWSEAPSLVELAISQRPVKAFRRPSDCFHYTGLDYIYPAIGIPGGFSEPFRMFSEVSKARPEILGSSLDSSTPYVWVSLA
jgi:hypothetical protein